MTAPRAFGATDIALAHIAVMASHRVHNGGSPLEFHISDFRKYGLKPLARDAIKALRDAGVLSVAVPSDRLGEAHGSREAGHLWAISRESLRHGRAIAEAAGMALKPPPIIRAA